MTVKVVVIVVAIGFLCIAHGDVSHLNLTDSEVEALPDDQPNTTVQPIGFQSRIELAEPEGPGYSYPKPDIPFETGNHEETGYDYPKPLNPMTYPPPLSSTTEQSFPDATARLRLN